MVAKCGWRGLATVKNRGPSRRRGFVFRDLVQNDLGKSKIKYPTLANEARMAPTRRSNLSFRFAIWKLVPLRRDKPDRWRHRCRHTRRRRHWRWQYAREFYGRLRREFRRPRARTDPR